MAMHKISPETPSPIAITASVFDVANADIHVPKRL
jgi:hypothetical protein